MTLTSPRAEPRTAAEPVAPPRRSRRRTWIILAVGAACACGIALRFGSPGALWLDEAISVDIAQLGPGGILTALRQDGHPPLYYLLLHGWMEILGDSAGSARALSAVFSIATIPLAWFAGMRLGGRRTAVIAMVLMATSPFAVRYATEARMYSLMALLSLAGYLAVLRALERPSAGRLAVVAGLAAGTILTHYWGIYLLGAAVILLLVAGRRSVLDRRAAWRVALAVVIGSLALVPWLPAFADQVAHTGTPWAQAVEPIDAGMDTLLDLAGGKWAGGRAMALLLSLTLLVALFGRPPQQRWELELDLRTVPGARPELALTALTLVLALGAAVVTASAFEPRYTAAVVPFLLLAVAVGIGRIPHPTGRVVVLSLLVVLGLAGSLRTVTRPRTQAGAISAAVADRAEAGDVVAFCPDQLRPAVTRGLPDEVLTRTFPAGSPPGRIDWSDYRDRIAAADPDRFARQLLDLAGPTGAVFLVSGDNYRGFGDDCTDVRVALDRARGQGQTVLSPDRAAYERAELRWYPAQ